MPSSIITNLPLVDEILLDFAQKIPLGDYDEIMCLPACIISCGACLTCGAKCVVQCPDCQRSTPYNEAKVDPDVHRGMASNARLNVVFLRCGQIAQECGDPPALKN